MRKVLCAILLTVMLAGPLAAAEKAIAFGKPLPVKRFIGPDEKTAVDIQVRPLLVNGKLREFTFGDPHDVTDRVFVVRHAFRLNDRLPENRKPVWRWQLGGWLQVDRDSGRVTRVALPEFDPFYSHASWFRDLAAYCGISEDGEHVYAVVAQLGNKKPLLRRALGAARNEPDPQSECAAPRWQRDPARVTFEPRGRAPMTFAVRAHGLEATATDPSPAQEHQQQ